MNVNNFRICLSDSNDGKTRYLWCKNCHKIITVKPPKMTFTRFEGDLTDFILLDSKITINARCDKCKSEFVEIHEDTVKAHSACADLGISIFYDYGEAIPYNKDPIMRNLTGDRPIFKFPSLTILDLGPSKDVKKCMYDDILSNRSRLSLIIREQCFDGTKFHAKFDSIIRTDLAKDTDELCSEEYFNKMNNEINYARDCIEQIIDKLIKSVK